MYIHIYIYTDVFTVFNTVGVINIHVNIFFFLNSSNAAIHIEY